MLRSMCHNSQASQIFPPLCFHIALTNMRRPRNFWRMTYEIISFMPSISVVSLYKKLKW